MTVVDEDDLTVEVVIVVRTLLVLEAVEVDDGAADELGLPPPPGTDTLAYNTPRPLVPT